MNMRASLTGRASAFQADQAGSTPAARPIRWRKYEAMKQAWIAANRNATPEQYQRAMAQIANRCGV